MQVRLILIAMVAVLFVSCSKDKKVDLDKPEKVLFGYINERFQVKSLSDRPKLLQFTTGKVKSIIENMSDEEFDEKFLKSNVELEKYRVITRKATGEGKAQVTYEISLKTRTGSGSERVWNKKVAVFSQVSEDWLISEVKNLKTTILLGEQSVVLDPEVP